MKLKISLVLLILGIGAGACATPKPKPGHFDQLVNPEDANDKRTFQQRYWVDSRFAKDLTSPVLYLVCGEDNCADRLDGRLALPTLAKALHAHIIALEHRYYGESLVFPSITGENLQYLTVDNEIRDLARFQRSMSSKYVGKWIAVGLSYGATLAAVLRQQHPELVAGAIASSACPKIDDSSIVNDQLAADVLGLECTAQYRSRVLSPILDALGNPAAMNPIKALFHASEFKDDLDFLGSMTGVIWFEVILHGAKDVCTAAASPTPLDSTAEVLNKLMDKLGSPLLGWSFQGMESPDASLYKSGIGIRQNMYQGCREMGLYNDVITRANPDTRRSILSTLTNPLPAKYCDTLFGIKKPPSNEEANRKYYYPLLNPSTSRILFVSGSKDPACFPMSISRENGNDTNPNTTVFTVQGGSHGSDLRAPTNQDSAPLKAARELELKLAKEWMQN